MRIVLIPIVLATALGFAQTGASRTALAIVTDAKNRAIVDMAPTTS